MFIRYFAGVNAAYAGWQDLGDRLEKHKAVMARLLEDAKVNLRHRAIALRDERERWQAKWSTKSSDDLTLDWLISMKERWINLNGQMDALRADCKRITLDLEDLLEDEDFDVSQIERELETEESNFRLAEIYNLLMKFLLLYLSITCSYYVTPNIFDKLALYLYR